MVAAALVLCEVLELTITVDSDGRLFIMTATVIDGTGCRGLCTLVSAGWEMCISF